MQLCNLPFERAVELRARPHDQGLPLLGRPGPPLLPDTLASVIPVGPVHPR